MPTIIYTNTKPQKKTPSTSAKKRALQASWAELQAKYEPKVSPGAKHHKTTKTTQATSILAPSTAYRRETVISPGVKVGVTEHTVVDGGCTAKPQQQYTGTAIVGIATMHKSNAVPCFSQEAAIDISKMRRG